MAGISLQELGSKARLAASALARASSAQKDEALARAADAIVAHEEEILEANALDVETARRDGQSDTVVDRLLLNRGRLEKVAEGLRGLRALPDPVGEVVAGWVLANELSVRRVRVPLGVIGVIYENRPNVTADAAGLCLKSGNAVLLRGSSGAICSNLAIARFLREGIAKAGLPSDAVQLVEDVSYETVEQFIKLRGVIDCLVPRGGPQLISLILDKATVPYVIDGDGNCHVYVDRAADLSMAESIVLNAKCQRPSVCNAMETLLVHEEIAEQFLPAIVRAMPEVELVGDEKSRRICPSIGVATEEDFATEFLALRLAIAVVTDLDGAIAHIARYSTGHSEAIVTNDYAAAKRFTNEVDAAAVLVNASTRFVDGGELGLGAEIGISNQKLHARGPMGLKELTSVKYVIEGSGQVRT